MAKLINGKSLRDKVLNSLKKEIEQKKLRPNLAIVLVGDDEASMRYIKQKQKAASEIGASATLVQLPDSVSQTEIIDNIQDLNKDQSVTGIIVQLPLPSQLDKEKILESIAEDKDVDGLSKDSPFKPATPLGILEILREYKVEISGKTAVVLGQSGLVGAPLSQMLEEQGAKVIRIDINTPKPIDQLVLQGDIVISAVGKINLVTSEMVKEGAVVIDVGTNLVQKSEIRDQKSGNRKNSEDGSLIADYRIVGDVDFEKVSGRASLITPVPGGVGPMTVASLMKNLVLASQLTK